MSKTCVTTYWLDTLELPNFKHGVRLSLQLMNKYIFFYRCSTFFGFLVQIHRPISFKLKYYLTSSLPNRHHRPFTFIRKGYHRFRIFCDFRCLAQNQIKILFGHGIYNKKVGNALSFLERNSLKFHLSYLANTLSNPVPIIGFARQRSASL